MASLAAALSAAWHLTKSMAPIGPDGFTHPSDTRTNSASIAISRPIACRLLTKVAYCCWWVSCKNFVSSSLPQPGGVGLERATAGGADGNFSAVFVIIGLQCRWRLRGRARYSRIPYQAKVILRDRQPIDPCARKAAYRGIALGGDRGRGALIWSGLGVPSPRPVDFDSGGSRRSPCHTARR